MAPAGGRFAAKADAILAAYGTVAPGRIAADIARDAPVGAQMAQWANFQHRYGHAPTDAYHFTRRQPYVPGIAFSDHDPATVGAYHTGDVPYWLRTRDALNLFRATRNWEPADASLERTMSEALLAFSRNGRPSSAATGAWPVFDPAVPHVMWLGKEQGPVAWPHFGDMALFGGVTAEVRAPGTSPRDRGGG